MEFLPLGVVGYITCKQQLKSPANSSQQQIGQDKHFATIFLEEMR